MYSRIVKIVPVTINGEDGEDVQYGILDREKNMVMSGFITFDEAEEELNYLGEEEEKAETFDEEA